MAESEFGSKPAVIRLRGHRGALESWQSDPRLKDVLPSKFGRDSQILEEGQPARLRLKV